MSAFPCPVIVIDSDWFHGFAVMMLHPQDFVDAKENFLPERLGHLRALLKEVKSNIRKYQKGALEKIRFCQ